jgi:hypothetical protein
MTWGWFGGWIIRNFGGGQVLILVRRMCKPQLYLEHFVKMEAHPNTDVAVDHRDVFHKW